MSMLWFSKNAKYLVYSFGALLLIGLVVMGDFTQNFGGKTATHVGSINGKSISLEEFRDQLAQYQEQERQRTGETPEGEKLVQIRQELFRYQIRLALLSEAKDKLGLYASASELWNYLETNPDPNLQRDSTFQTNGQFDFSKYMRWIHDEANLSHPYLQYMEAQLKNTVIPENQLKTLLRNQYFLTHLEQAADEAIQNTQVRFVHAQIPLDSIDFPEKNITDEEVKEYFNAHPDSFYTPYSQAKVNYLKFNLEPSANDSQVAIEILEDLKSRIENGTPFEELAESYSDDNGSAKNGGSLGGPQPLESWVPSFSAAAQNLQIGQLSGIVLSPFGYHLLKLNNIVEEAGAKKYDVSHILIKVTASSETSDSLVAILEKIRENAKSGGLEKLASSQPKLLFQNSGFFNEKDFVPLKSEGYIPGLTSFVFSKEQKKQKISEVLQNEKSVYLFEKVALHEKGRNLESSKDKVKAQLVLQKKQELAKKMLEEKKSAIAAWYTQLGPIPAKVKIDSTEKVSINSYIDGFGYASPHVYKISLQPEKEWGPIYQTPSSVAIALLLEKNGVDINSRLDSLKNTPPTEQNFITNTLLNTWYDMMEKGAKIVNNLDNLYRI